MTMFAHMAAGAALTALVVAVGQGAVSLYQDWTSPPVPRTLTLIDIEYQDGEIRQLIQPAGAEAIAGKWAAKIVRDGRHICGGSGGSNYTGKMFVGTPSVWTGDRCPPLEPGDVASATWEWQDNEGHIRSMSVTFMIDG